MNLGATYDGDFGNEVVIGNIITSFSTKNAEPTEQYDVPKQGDGGAEKKFISWKAARVHHFQDKRTCYGRATGLLLYQGRQQDNEQCHKH